MSAGDALSEAIKAAARATAQLHVLLALSGERIEHLPVLLKLPPGVKEAHAAYGATMERVVELLAAEQGKTLADLTDPQKVRFAVLAYDAVMSSRSLVDGPAEVAPPDAAA